MMTFDIKNYIENLCNQFSQEAGFDFSFTEVSGIKGLEGIISGQTAEDNFIATDATGDGTLFQQRNGGFFIRRFTTIFIVRKYTYGDMTDMRYNMTVCRQWLKRILRQMIADRENLSYNLVYLNVDRIAFREMAPETAGHFTGLYFMLEYSQPYDVL